MSCNISGLKKEKCYGCYACYNICPLNAIDMLEDEEGFEYPKVNEEKCINCKRCLRACPSINPPHVNSDTAAYACYAKNQEEHMSSSSGGIFAIIARKILKNKGMVFGAAFDNQMKLGHISIEDNNELYKVKGTKYIQSSIGTTFVKVKENLKKGRMILFSGTPCQIAGLKAFLNEDYDNLLCVDLICHGVPSPGVWKRYLKEQFGSNKVISMQFRNKTRGINDVTLDYTLTNGSVFREHYKESSYIQGFINKINIKEAEEKEFLIEKLYLLLIENGKIRSNQKIKSINDVEIDKAVIGEPIFVVYVNEQNIDLFGNVITFYMVSSIFNAIAEDIKKDENGKKKLLFSDTDSNPMYRVYSGFLNKKEAEKEEKRVINKIEEYKEAKTLEEYLEQLREGIV